MRPSTSSFFRPALAEYGLEEAADVGNRRERWVGAAVATAAIIGTENRATVARDAAG